MATDIHISKSKKDTEMVIDGSPVVWIDQVDNIVYFFTILKTYRMRLHK